MKTEKQSTGQSGPKIKLTIGQLNKDEAAIYAVARRRRTTWQWKVAEMAEVAFNNKPSVEQAKSRVRNALRRLVRCSGIKHSRDRGEYMFGATLQAGKPVSLGIKTGGKVKKRAVPKTSRKAAPTPRHTVPTGHSVTLEQLRARVSELEPVPVEAQPLSNGPDTDKAALILVAVEELGPSSTAIAKVTNYSRGYVIRRLKSVAGELPKEATPRFFTAEKFWPLVQKAAQA